jgi:hypothetical protein
MVLPYVCSSLPLPETSRFVQSPAVITRTLRNVIYHGQRRKHSSGHIIPFQTARGESMSLDVWFQQDIRSTLAALRVAQSSQLDGAKVVESSILGEREAYRAGFEAAIRSVALAFGVTVDERVSAGACRWATRPEPGSAIGWPAAESQIGCDARAA